MTAPTILLADDDSDDRLFFQEALKDLLFSQHILTVSDGVELMQFLSENIDNLPEIIFLDLNMPRKSGYECLLEIKNNILFNKVHIIVFSTSSDEEVMNLLYDKGADYYICKPGNFSHLKGVLLKVLQKISGKKAEQPPREHFIINFQCNFE